MADTVRNPAPSGLLPQFQRDLGGVRAAVTLVVLVSAAISLAWIAQSVSDAPSLAVCLAASAALLACAAALAQSRLSPEVERTALAADALSLLCAALLAPAALLNDWSSSDLTLAVLTVVAAASIWIGQTVTGPPSFRVSTLLTGSLLAVIVCGAMWALQEVKGLPMPGSSVGPIALAAVAPLFSAGASRRQPLSIALGIGSAAIVVLALLVDAEHRLLLATCGMLAIGGLVATRRTQDDPVDDSDLLGRRKSWIPAVSLAALLLAVFGLEDAWRWLAVASFAAVAVATISAQGVDLIVRERLLERLTDLARLAAHHARIDPLTRLPNRAALDVRLNEEVERSLRYRHPISILFIDVDHFKSINDLLGHQAGDRALHEIGGVIRTTIRTPDFVARFGGEEFVVIAPGTWSIDATVLGRRIQSAVGEAVRHADGKPVSVSVGIAGVPEHADSPETVLRAADEALYRAKHAGRNRVEIAESTPV